MSDKIPVALITRYLSNEATSEEQQQLLSWISSDVKNQKIFHSYSETWKRKNPAMHSFAAGEALERLNSRIDRWQDDHKIKQHTNYWYKIAAAVAFFILAGGAGVFWFIAQNATTPLIYLETVTKSGERISIQLADGSKITLNANASLRYPEVFDEAAREVFLEGEAFFDIERDTSRPFIIHTKALDTEVLGTSFNIASDSISTIVSVATGRVKVYSGALSETLVPADQASYRKDAGKIQKMKIDINRAVAWTTNTIVFENNNLLKVSEELEQWFGAEISFENTDLHHCLITGTYRNETLHHIMEAISFSTGVHYTIDGNKVRISGRGCGK
jgi:transmembrane sensor